MSAQSMSALAKANERRLAIAAARRRIAKLSYRDGCREAAAVVRAGASPSLTAARLVTAIRQVGRRRALLWERETGVRFDRRLDQLTARQRGALADFLAGVPSRATFCRGCDAKISTRRESGLCGWCEQQAAVA